MIANIKNVRKSARKLRLVADVVRRMNVQDALRTLEILNKSTSRSIREAIKSAYANMVVKLGPQSQESVVIDSIEVNSGAQIKRVKMGSKGSVERFVRKMSHITVKLK